MPLYEYECGACGHRFEKIVKFSDAPIETCPACGGTIRKLISSPAFQFKGSGFYITDYPKKDQPGDSKDGRDSKDGKGQGAEGGGSPAPTDTAAAKDGGGKPAKETSAKSDTASPPAPSAAPSKPAKD